MSDRFARFLVKMRSKFLFMICFLFCLESTHFMTRNLDTTLFAKITTKKSLNSLGCSYLLLMLFFFKLVSVLVLLPVIRAYEQYFKRMNGFYGARRILEWWSLCVRVLCVLYSIYLRLSYICFEATPSIHQHIDQKRLGAYCKWCIFNKIKMHFHHFIANWPLSTQLTYCFTNFLFLWQN